MIPFPHKLKPNKFFTKLNLTKQYSIKLFIHGSITGLLYLVVDLVVVVVVVVEVVVAVVVVVVVVVVVGTKLDSLSKKLASLLSWYVCISVTCSCLFFCLIH